MRVKFIAQKPKLNFETTMISLSLWDCSDAHILLKGIITTTRAGADVAAWKADERDKK